MTYVQLTGMNDMTQHIYLPFGVFFQLIKHRSLAVLKYEVQFAISFEHFDQVDKVGVLKLLKQQGTMLALVENCSLA